MTITSAIGDRKSAIVISKRISSYKDLDVWKKGIEIVDRVYEITATFPSEERFGLVVQMQRSAVSIPSNVAEGFARQRTKEYQQFCRVSLGSCAELETQAIIANRRGYVAAEVMTRLEELLDHESRMLMNLIKRLSANATVKPVKGG